MSFVSKQRMAEHREQMRITAQDVLDRSQSGETLTAEARAWAMRWAGIESPGGGKQPNAECRGAEQP